KYLEEQDITEEEIKAGLRRGTVAGVLVPVLCGAALRNRGVQPILDAVVDYLPSPADVPAVEGKDPKTGALEVREHDDNEPFSAPVISVAIEPKTKADQEKLGMALQRLSEEDPTFKVHTDEETGQTIIEGMGELHVEIIIDRLLREFRVDANQGKPQVAYKEAIRREAKGIGRFVRQTGGKGQYGHAEVVVRPGEQGSGFIFEDKVTQGRIPREYIPAVEK